MLTLETQLLETKTLLTKRKRDQEDSPHSGNNYGLYVLYVAGNFEGIIAYDWCVQNSRFIS